MPPRSRTVASRRKPKPLEAAERVRHLLSLDAANLMKRLLVRQTEMVALFSRMRSRAPMLEAVRTWFGTVTFGELVVLEPVEQRAVSHFYEVVDEVRWYLEYTEDMPGTVLQKLAKRVVQLEKAHRALVEVIGPPHADGVRVVDAEVVHKRSVPRGGVE
jgi:hypothetical protein